jgi:hypothetical protein
MPAGASGKREREYKELKHKFQESGRYKGREDEVASRIVNKQRSRYGETKEAKEKDHSGKSPDRGLPLDQYQHMTIPEVKRKLNGLSSGDIRKLQRYESKHKNRKGMQTLFDRYLNKA